MITMNEHLSVLTAEVLRDLARNEAAGRAVRKMAIQLLIDKNHIYANHPDFRELRLEIQEEQEARYEVESIIAQVSRGDTEVEDVKEENHGPFKASFTTKNL